MNLVFGQCVDGLSYGVLQSVKKNEKWNGENTWSDDNNKLHEESLRPRTNFSFTNWKSTTNGNGADEARKTRRETSFNAPTTCKQRTHVETQAISTTVRAQKYHLASYVYFYHTVIEKLERNFFFRKDIKARNRWKVLLSLTACMWL